MSRRARSTVRRRVSRADGDYAMVIIVGKNAVFESKIGDVQVKQALSVRRAMQMYRKAQRKLMEIHGYLFEVV
ncbi:MAG: hypothetical protein QW706_10025 [Candidatus Nezhaarchaeales archaeon]